jgi:hypothetical protein
VGSEMCIRDRSYAQAIQELEQARHKYAMSYFRLKVFTGSQTDALIEQLNAAAYASEKR